LISALSLCLALAAGQPTHVLLLSFDGEELGADRNDWGSLQPCEAKGFRLSPPGSGCPANPRGRALDAGYSPELDKGRLALPLPTDADLRQGTLELWFKPRWAMGARELHTLAHVKLRGGPWNAIWLGYHGTIGETTAAFGGNIMDGVDHPAYVSDAAAQLAWQAGEWHHVAFVWTEHSEYLFADGKLVTHVLVGPPLRIRRTEGEVALGAPFRQETPVAAALIDEVRLCDVPLYAPDHPPDIMRRVTADLGLGLAGPGSGAQASADSAAAPHQLESDVPELHDGLYGAAVQVGDEPGQGTVLIHLPTEAEVSAFEWSRDGVAYAGPQGRGWATVLPFPRAFVVETSRDGQNWEEAVREADFHVTPLFVATHEALRFRHDFVPRLARQVRMVIQRGPRGDPAMLLDEVAVYGPDGRNWARLPGARVETARTHLVRRYDPALALDGRWGEESCWRSATAGRGTLTIQLPAPAQVRRVIFSRSHEGLARDGTPTTGRLELSLDGTTWLPVAQIQGDDPKPRSLDFPPQPAQFLRLVITATADGKEATLDDVRVY
jgi:hypothetical protein